ncbi:MAG: PKD domain-containing protein, partial [Gammaproteobacteria bacterium]|nr:PKD domain-containing protein [Gammaproteobacteria bacterium]
MNKYKKSSNKAGYFPILMCFIMISSGLCIFPTVGEYTSGYQDYIEDIEYQGDDTLPIDMNFKGEDTNENAELIEINLQTESEIISTNIPPVADAGPDITLNVGPHAFMYSVPFNGSGSYDLDGIIIDYLWDFGDGNTSQGEFRIHFYASPGNYTVTLMVTDDFGANNTDTMVVTLIEMPAWTVTTDKYTYLISEPVVIFFWGVMSLPALGDHWYKIEDENGNLVVDNSFMVRATAIQMVSDPYTEIWDQAYYGVPQHGQQIPTGKYYVWFGWTQKQFGPAEFEIINSSDDLTEPLKVTTDKYTYYIGEPVYITIIGYRLGRSSDFNTGYTIKDEFGHWVRDPPQLHSTDIYPWWGPDNYTWQQKYEVLYEYDIDGNYQIHYPNNSRQVSTGKYYIYPMPGNCTPAEIEIIERPELKIDKVKISGPDEVLTHTYHEWELKI